MYTDIVHSLRIILIQQLLICVVFSVFWKCLLIDTTNTQYIYYEIYFLSTLWWYQQFWENNPWTISNIFVLCFLPFLFIFFRTSRETNKKVSKLILHTIICEQWNITLLCKEALCLWKWEFLSRVWPVYKKTACICRNLFCPSRQASLIVCASDCIS